MEIKKLKKKGNREWIKERKMKEMK